MRGPDTRKINVGSVVVEVIRDGDRIVSSIESGKAFETDSLAAWAVMCGGGGMVLDVGAYTGLFTISARMMGCQVIPFEPMPFNRLRLRENAKINGVDGSVNSEVLGDIVGETTIHYNPIPFTSGASLLRKTGAVLKVRSLTVDSLKLQKLHGIKIDVERAESLVLKGAMETLRRLRPPMLVEVLDEDQEQKVLDVLGGLYRVERRLDVRNWSMVPC